jgi:ankyrin repeat protein
MKCLALVLSAVLSLSCLAAAAQSPANAAYFRLDNYTGTAHDLALAVERQQAGRIRHLIAADASLANVREPAQGMTLLHYAVRSGRYAAAEALLQSGADPNACATQSGRAPVHEAADKRDTSKFLQLLLSHGGDPNVETTPAHPDAFTNTPLTFAAGTRLQSVQLLLQAGADLNHVTRKGHDSALGTALTMEQLPIALFLLVEKNADYTVACGETVDGRVLSLSNALRNLTPEPESEKWRQKQQIVAFLRAHGVDYRAAPVPYRVRHSFGQAYIDAY